MKCESLRNQFGEQLEDYDKLTSHLGQECKYNQPKYKGEGLFAYRFKQRFANVSIVVTNAAES